MKPAGPMNGIEPLPRDAEPMGLRSEGEPGSAHTEGSPVCARGSKDHYGHA